MMEAFQDPIARETEQLMDLVGAIYDTVLDRTIWPDVLRKVSLFVDGAASAVFWEDAASDRGDAYFEDGGITAHYADLYFNKYVGLNPTTIPRLFANVEEPIATADLCPYGEFLQTRFYREWAEPQGLVDFISVTLEKAAAKAAMFGVFRHARHGVVDETARRRMRLLAPHIRRAVLISKVVDFKRGEAEMLSENSGSSPRGGHPRRRWRPHHSRQRRWPGYPFGGPCRSGGQRLSRRSRARDGQAAARSFARCRRRG